MIENADIILSLLLKFTPSFIKETWKRFFQKNSIEKQKKKLIQKWSRLLSTVIENGGRKSDKIELVVKSKYIKGLFLQSLNKDKKLTTKDFAFILARENFLGLSPIETVQLADTFGKKLNASIKQDKVASSVLKKIGIHESLEICELSDLDNPEFLAILSNHNELNKAYYTHFSNEVKSEQDNLTSIKVYYSNEMGALLKSLDYSVDIKVNLFKSDEISPAFFTSNTDYVLSQGELGDQLKQVSMDVNGAVQFTFGEESYGQLNGAAECIWDS